MFRPRLLLSLAILPFSCQSAMGGSAAANDKPAAPSGLSVKALGVNTFKVKWKDNSDNENGWEIQYIPKGAPAALLQRVTVGAADIGSYVVPTSELPAAVLVFQMRSYRILDGKQIFSNFTPKIEVKTPSTTIFKDPVGLKAKTTGDGSFRISWTDNSNCETAYLVEYKKPSDKKWEVLGNTGPDEKFNVKLLGAFTPSTEYMFRVQAIRGTSFSKYSNTSKATTLPFQAPSNLVVIPGSDGKFSFKWKDNSTAEGGFQFQEKVGDGGFESLGTIGKDNTSANDVSGFLLNKTYQFRMRGYRTVGTKTVYSAFTKTVFVKASSVAKPTDVKVAVKDEYTMKVTWKDASARETSYKVQYRKAGTTDGFKEVVLAGNIVETEVANLIPGTLYDFRVMAIASDSTGTLGIGVSSTVQSRTKDGIASTLNPEIFHEVPFAYDILISRASELKSPLEVTNLPEGLAYDDTLRRVSGTLGGEGVKSFTVKATFKTGAPLTRSIVLRVIRQAAPPVSTEFGPVSVAAAGNTNVSLAGKFSDPDTESAARFTTTKGSFDVILYSKATPATVENFLDYIDADRYENTFFHRSVDDAGKQLVILQGGGYSYTSAAGFKSVTKFMQPGSTTKPLEVANEPGISNMRGTVGLAKLGTAANSGSSEFYVNLDDVNAGNLDKQNSGFTVFGRIPEAGLETIQAIHDLPTGDYSISGFASSTFTDVPMDAVSAPAAMEPGKLVKVTAVTAAPILTYEVESQNTAVATASLNGTQITIHGVAAGGTNVVVTATDLDGNEVSENIAVTVTAP